MRRSKALTRRTFLARGTKLALAGIAVPAIAPSGVIAFDGKPGANDRIQVGFIGSGHRSRLLMSQMPKEGQIVAICDIDLRRCRHALKEKKANWQVYQDYESFSRRRISTLSSCPRPTMAAFFRASMHVRLARTSTRRNR